MEFTIKMSEQMIAVIGGAAEASIRLHASCGFEQAGRIRGYLITMGIRTVCFVLSVVTATKGAPWWLWGSLAVAAILLPYVAVVLANAVRPRPPGSSAPVTPRGDGPDQIDR